MAKMQRGTKDRILREASKQFARKGFAETSMTDIAKAVGIEKASLYYFFKDKQELFGAILERLWGGLADHLRASPGLNRKPISVKDFKDYIVLIIKTNLRAGLGILKFDSSVPSWGGCVEAHHHVDYMRKRLREFLREQKVRDLKAAETLIIHSIFGYVTRAQLIKPEIPPEKYGHYLVDIILNK